MLIVIVIITITKKYITITITIISTWLLGSPLMYLTSWGHWASQYPVPKPAPTWFPELKGNVEKLGGHYSDLGKLPTPRLSASPRSRAPHWDRREAVAKFFYQGFFSTWLNLRVVNVEGELLVLQLEHVVVGAGGVHQVVPRSGWRLSCWWWNDWIKWWL